MTGGALSWECAECNVREDKNSRIALCHHCGKPLCRGDRVEIIDIAFAGAPGRIGQVAVHCKQCRRTYHRSDISQGGEER
jgi:hypothetical protein